MKNFEKLVNLNELFSKKYNSGGILSLSVNEHRISYLNIREYLQIDESWCEDLEGIYRCENSGNIYEIRLYNFTPVGHYSVFDSTLDGAALKILNALEEDKDDIIVNYKSIVKSEIN